MPTIKKHNSRGAAKKWTAERTTHQNSKDQNAPITAVENQPITAEHSAFKVSRHQYAVEMSQFTS